MSFRSRSVHQFTPELLLVLIANPSSKAYSDLLGLNLWVQRGAQESGCEQPSGDIYGSPALQPHLAYDNVSDS